MKSTFLGLGIGIIVATFAGIAFMTFSGEDKIKNSIVVSNPINENQEKIIIKDRDENLVIKLNN